MAPLRKVIESFNDKETGAMKERLECGHVQNVKQDIYGYTYANKRRCRKCAAESDYQVQG